MVRKRNGRHQSEPNAHPNTQLAAAHLQLLLLLQPRESWVLTILCRPHSVVQLHWLVTKSLSPSWDLQNDGLPLDVRRSSIIREKKHQSVSREKGRTVVVKDCRKLRFQHLTLMVDCKSTVTKKVVWYNEGGASGSVCNGEVLMCFVKTPLDNAVWPLSN